MGIFRPLFHTLPSGRRPVCEGYLHIDEITFFCLHALSNIVILAIAIWVAVIVMYLTFALHSPVALLSISALEFSVLTY